MTKVNQQAVRPTRFKVVCPCGWNNYRENLNNTLCPQCGEQSVQRPTLERVDLPGEEWREIPGFGGNYLASNLGRLFSVQRPRTTGGIISQHLGTNGYLGALLYQGNKASGRIYSVHRLVLAAFRGECPEGMESLHGDGNRQNNRIENLRWGTHAENTADQIRHRKERQAA